MQFLEFFNLDINNAKRVEESFILRSLIQDGEVSIQELKRQIKSEFDYDLTRTTIESCLINLNFQFIRKNLDVVNIIQDIIYAGNDLKELLKNDEFKRILQDNTDYSITAFSNKLSNIFLNKLISPST